MIVEGLIFRNNFADVERFLDGSNSKVTQIAYRGKGCCISLENGVSHYVGYRDCILLEDNGDVYSLTWETFEPRFVYSNEELERAIMMSIIRKGIFKIDVDKERCLVRIMHEGEWVRWEHLEIIMKLNEKGGEND